MDRPPKNHGIAIRLLLATNKDNAPKQLPGPALLGQIVVERKNKIPVNETALYLSPNMQVVHFIKGSI